MATKYFCDKCDRETKTADELIPVTASSTYNATKTVVICERCMTRLHDWLRPDAKAAKE